MSRRTLTGENLISSHKQAVKGISRQGREDYARNGFGSEDRVCAYDTREAAFCFLLPYPQPLPALEEMTRQQPGKLFAVCERQSSRVTPFCSSLRTDLKLGHQPRRQRCEERLREIIKPSIAICTSAKSNQSPVNHGTCTK